MPENLGQRLAEAALAETPTEQPTSAMLVIKGHYLFETQGGHGTFGLTQDTPIPAGAIIVGGFIHVTETVTAGAGGTITVQVEGAADLVTAMVIATWAAGAKLNIKPSPTSGSATASTNVLTTAARDISATVAVNDLTDGAFDVYLFVIVP